MPKIYELDPHVADLIAAGEVVERPASVVKELLENAIDAGAKVITTEIVAGGMTYIRVTDNGCGMAPDDAKKAFLRHATSKLLDAQGLEAISTLGFRGEALAAIAAVSRIELLTREQGAGEGISLSIEAGVVSDISPAGCPEGTTIIVRDLFYNTPARLKFMKSDRSESSAIATTVLRSALSRPDVSIRLLRDGKTEYHTPGDSRMDSCIYSLLGRDFAAELLPAETSDEAISVTGFVCDPNAARGNRSYQFFFVNGRPIQSRTLQAALEQAYANMLPSGRFPSCALYITASYAAVDVNVHPAKTEVKFVSDKQVFDGVYYAALGAISAQNAQGLGVRDQGSGGASYERSATGNRDMGIARGYEGFRSMSAAEFREKYSSETTDRQRISEPKSTYYEFSDNSEFRIPSSKFNNNSEYQIPNSEFKVIGEAMKMYIIAEYLDAVWFIDKHAAHERIRFDALKGANFEPMSQTLITPVICRPGREEAEVLLENTELLERLGFSVESFGEDAVAVRNIPSEIEIADTEPILGDICASLKLGSSQTPALYDAIYRSIACKAAIKAGKSSDMRELEVLAARVFSGEITHCPHGRPVAYEITKAALDRGFRRT